MRKLRYTFRLTLAFLSRFKVILILGIILGFVIFFGIRTFFPYFSNRSNKIVGVSGRYNPSNLPDFILKQVGGGLTKIDENGIPSPNLAQTWETPDSGKTWIFKLKEKLYWHDGKALTSYDVKYDFSDVDIETPDDRTIIFKLQNPFSPFPSIVSKPVFRKGLLGTGEWKVDKITLAGENIQDLSILKDKNKIIYKFYPTEERVKTAYKLGEIDFINSVYNPSPIDEWGSSNTNKEINFDQVVTVFFNTKEGITGDKFTRQALIYAIRKDGLSETRSISPISPSSWAYNPQVKKYDYDFDRAKEIIEELPEELLEQLPIKLVSTPLLLSVAETISSQWREVGLETTVQVSSVVPTSDYHAYLTILDIPDDPDQYYLWHSTQNVTNISHYSNPRIDKLLEDGRAELVLENRKKIYLDFQRFLIEDSPAAFLYHPSWYEIERK